VLERLERQEPRAPVDDLQIEETVAGLLVAVLATAYGAVGSSHRWPTVASQDRVLNRTRALLALLFREPLGLTEIAKAVGSSTFHLSRLFRRATGVTLHGWRHRLRLHAALEAIARPESGHDLTGIALDLGFSSHSHFTSAFHTAFGKTQSAIRRSDAARLDLRRSE
jgi:AraC family transcriptional regulator